MAKSINSDTNKFIQQYCFQIPQETRSLFNPSDFIGKFHTEIFAQFSSRVPLEVHTEIFPRVSLGIYPGIRSENISGVSSAVPQKNIRKFLLKIIKFLKNFSKSSHGNSSRNLYVLIPHIFKFQKL